MKRKEEVKKAGVNIFFPFIAGLAISMVFMSCNGFQADDDLIGDGDSLDIIISDSDRSYPIVGTGISKYFGNLNVISEPAPSDAFFGQDAHYPGNISSYSNNGDGTISDLVTDLMWTQSLDLNGDGTIDAADKLSFSELEDYAKNLRTGGHSDWRIPSIKELYSLTDFSGLDPSGYNGSADGLVPFINTEYFAFAYGDESAGERIIDAQMATTTTYVGQAMNSNDIMFGFNFADGRIKGYPSGRMPNGEMKGFYVYFVRGTQDYGINKFVDNNDGTISDRATGLMWDQNDSEEGMSWEAALAWVQERNAEEYLGYSDWKLPNIKELQSLLDYTRSPQTTNSAAIDPLFSCTEIVDEEGGMNYGFYWSSTTHENMRNGANACYMAFGDAFGYMSMPPNSGNYTFMDVHGAGAQRSDPKVGDPDDYPYGHGPQGDVIRIFNLVRCVRTIK